MYPLLPNIISLFILMRNVTPVTSVELHHKIGGTFQESGESLLALMCNLTHSICNVTPVISVKLHHKIGGSKAATSFMVKYYTIFLQCT